MKLVFVAQCQLKIHNITHDSKSHGGSSGCPCTVYETGAPLFCDDLPVGTVGLRSACHFFNLTRGKDYLIRTGRIKAPEFCFRV